MKTKRTRLLLLLLIAGCDKPTELPPPPRPALVMEVGSKSETNSMSLVGEVRPRYESTQGFRIDGKIIERKVEVGSRVKKGQLIAKLDPSISDLNFLAAQAEVREAEANRVLAKAELSRYRHLFSKKFVSVTALDSKVAELKSADARVAQAMAKAQITVNQSSYSNLTADRDGVITMIHAEPGQVVRTGDTVAKIADTLAIEVLVAVPESRIADIRLKSRVMVRLWLNLEKHYTGFVREIAPAADSATRAFNVRIAIENADGAVKLGETARVNFVPHKELEANSFVIPSTALTEIHGKKMVWIIDKNHKAQPREVVTSAFSEDGITIISGLETGEKIAVAGVHTLSKDQEVRPIFEAIP